MKDHIDNSKTKTLKKFFVLLLIPILLTICSFVLMSIMLYPSIQSDKISVINNKAKNHYNIISDNYDDFSKIIDFSEESFFIIGECRDNDYYLAYANEQVSKDYILYGTDNGIVNGYWAIEITDNKITQVWASNYPLTQKQLVPYAINEQKKRIGMFEKTNETKAIGYYRID